jgi:hypothetical protein
MSNSKYPRIDTKHLRSNIMDLRDEPFYQLVHQFSGKRLTELLTFQECNGVDSFLGCKDIFAILHLKSDQLQKSTCITLNDGTIALLPGLESSVSNLVKILKKKRDEINKQTQRLQLITSSVLPVPSTTSPVLPTTTVSISHPSMHTPSSSNALITDNSSNSSSINFLTTSNPLTDEISNQISATIIDWLKKKQQELKLMNINFQQGIDFHIELNKRRDGVVMRCKCGMGVRVSYILRSATTHFGLFQGPHRVALLPLKFV